MAEVDPAHRLDSSQSHCIEVIAKVGQSSLFALKAHFVLKGMSAGLHLYTAQNYQFGFVGKPIWVIQFSVIQVNSWLMT